MIARASRRSFAVLAIGVAACGTTRQLGRYDTPISMTSDEGERADRLMAGAKALRGDPHRECAYWQRAERGIGRDSPGLAQYAKGARESACGQDPAYEYERPVAVREAFFAEKTAGYLPDGPPLEVPLRGSVSVPLERSRCYQALFRFAPGYAPKGRLQFEYKRPGSSGYENAPHGPGGLIDMGCVFKSAPGLISLVGNDGEPSASAQVQLVAKSLSPAETAQEEANHRARLARAARMERAFTPDKRSHCQRCAHDYSSCIGDRVAGQRPPYGTCLEGYLHCLDEDRGDAQVTASECAELE